MEQSSPILKHSHTFLEPNLKINQILKDPQVAQSESA